MVNSASTDDKISVIHRALRAAREEIIWHLSRWHAVSTQEMEQYLRDFPDARTEALKIIDLALTVMSETNWGAVKTCDKTRDPKTTS